MASAPWPRRRERRGLRSPSSCCVCMEMCTDKAVVAPIPSTPSTAIPRSFRTVGAPEGALLGASNPRSRLTVHSTSPTPAPAQALINCGHIYHLSCARRWFQTKGKSERGRPAHAPCPKCKEPYDMGSAVTVFMDVPKDERGEILFSPTPPVARRARRRPGRRRRRRPRLPAGRGGTERHSRWGRRYPPRGCEPPTRPPTRQTRARRRMTAPRAPRWPPNAPTVSRRNATVKPSSSQRTTRKQRALRGENRKAKAKKASDELSSRLAGFSARRAADVHRESAASGAGSERGGVDGGGGAPRRFRREEPRSTVETLCRSLAGKNRQLARQIDEYGKLVRRVKQLERGAGPAGVGRPSRVRRAPVRYRRGARRRRRGRVKKTDGGPGRGAPGGGQLDRSKRRVGRRRRRRVGRVVADDALHCAVR